MQAGILDGHERIEWWQGQAVKPAGGKPSCNSINNLAERSGGFDGGANAGIACRVKELGLREIDLDRDLIGRARTGDCDLEIAAASESCRNGGIWSGGKRLLAGGRRSAMVAGDAGKSQPFPGIPAANFW